LLEERYSLRRNVSEHGTYSQFAQKQTPALQHGEVVTTTAVVVWQDKVAPQRDSIATIHPAPPKEMMRPHHLNTLFSRSQKNSTTT